MPTTIQGENVGQQLGVSGLLGRALSVNLNSVADTSIPVVAAKYIVRRVVVANPSVDLTASLVQVGLHTEAAGAGTVIVTIAAVLATGLTAEVDAKDLTVALAGRSLTFAALFFRVGVAHGSAATADVYIFGDVLP